MADCYFVVCRMIGRFADDKRQLHGHIWSISGPFTQRRTAERATINAMKREGTISAKITSLKTLLRLKKVNDKTLRDEVERAIMLTTEWE